MLICSTLRITYIYHYLLAMSRDEC